MHLLVADATPHDVDDALQLYKIYVTAHCARGYPWVLSTAFIVVVQRARARTTALNASVSSVSRRFAIKTHRIDPWHVVPLRS